MKHLNRTPAPTLNAKRTQKIRRGYFCLTATLAVLLLTAAPALADDALDTINKLSDFVFDAIRALGVIILGWGIVQIGMSLQSHDSSQRTNGFLGFFGGLLIAFSKTILTAIGV